MKLTLRFWPFHGVVRAHGSYGQPPKSRVVPLQVIRKQLPQTESPRSQRWGMVCEMCCFVKVAHVHKSYQKPPIAVRIQRAQRPELRVAHSLRVDCASHLEKSAREACAGGTGPTGSRHL